jgi:hypothetical protein
LLIEVPLEVDAVGFRRHRATDDLEQQVPRVIVEFAEETPGVELVEVAAEQSADHIGDPQRSFSKGTCRTFPAPPFRRRKASIHG